MEKENLSDKETESMEAEIRARREGYNNRETVQHYGSAENLSDRETESMEAEIKARREGYNNRETVQHYGSVENLDDAGIRSMEAQVAEKRKKEIPQVDYLKSLLDNPEIIDVEQFKDIVSKSVESGTLKKYKFNGEDRESFVEAVFSQVGQKVYQLKLVDKNDKDAIEKTKGDIEKLVTVYEKYMYELKENQFNFSNLETMKMPEYLKEDLWQQQKRLDIVFKMPIPADLGKEYGKKFERDGKMIPGLEFMYQHLSGKEVNWHQLMINREKLQNIMPSDAAKNALKAGITADKVKEANVVERSGLDLEKNNEGVTKDDD